MSKSKQDSIEFLWRTFLDGDDKSFSVIYQQYIDSLLAYGLKLHTDREIVHDCLQEVFIDLFLKRQKINVRIENLKSYLFVALRNCLIKKIKQNKKFESLEKDRFSEEIEFNIEYSFQDKLIELEISNEIKQKLHNAIVNLPDRQKEIIYLKFEEGLDYKEISTILKISVESARKLLYRALLSLREVIDKKVIHLLFLISFKNYPDSVSMF